VEREIVELEVEALAVRVLPNCADFSPVGFVAGLGDRIGPMRR
jgi:hypothetical protein